MPINKLTNQLVNFLFPPLCVHCGREGAWLCAKAQALLRAESLFDETITLPNIDGIFIRGSYDCLILQQLIQKLKYSYWSAASAVLPEVLAPLSVALKQLPPDTVVVPVPLHARRVRERGFNQSMLIAGALGQLTSWPVQTLLKRYRYTTPQAQLSEKSRLKNVVDAFMIAQKHPKTAQSVLLVDDVLTTGSTLTECAKVLKEKGVKNVYTCTLAKG